MLGGTSQTQSSARNAPERDSRLTSVWSLTSAMAGSTYPQGLRIMRVKPNPPKLAILRRGCPRKKVTVHRGRSPSWRRRGPVHVFGRRFSTGTCFPRGKMDQSPDCERLR